MKLITSKQFLLISQIINIIITQSIDPTTLDNHCVGKEDGDHWLLLDTNDNDYTPVKLTCNNEHIILDVNKDSNLLNYFSSFEKWHYAIGGPKNADPVNWQEWFLPYIDDNDAQYYISPDCAVCDTNNEMQVFDELTSYYMTGNLAKLMWGVIGFNECDFDKDSYQCYDCSDCLSTDDNVVCDAKAFAVTATDYQKAGICGVAVQSAAMEVSKTRKLAQTPGSNGHYKPSIGTDGRFCMCYQPSEAYRQSFALTETQMESVSVSEDNSNTNSKNNIKITNHLRVDGHEMDNAGIESTADLRNGNIVYLSQKHFNEGTLRITKSGTYVIIEDIVFDFNKDDDYWPRSDQSGEYPGAGAYRDPYHLGFFAGITIESDYVTIDLNGKELKQSIEFYYQQRWFAIIELGNQQFLPGQGPAFFGSDSINIDHVSIKNGVLGRTSHFAIHGNYATNINIENVHIRDFVTHGLQLNGWEYLSMMNVEIGPSSTIEYLRGDYGHARIMIDRLRAIESDLIAAGTIDDAENHLRLQSKYYTTEVQSISEIVDELELQMEYAYDYAMNRVNNLYEYNSYINPKYSDNDDNFELRWKAAKKQFIHESGLPSASSITGLFLNFMGASVFTYAKYTTHKSNNGILSNIYIHDIQHDMVESIRFARTTDSGQTYPTPWNSDVPAEGAFGSFDTLVQFRNLVVINDDVSDDDSDSYIDISQELSEYKYIGSIMSDAYLAMGTFSDDWGYLGFLQISRSEDYTLTDWAEGTGIASDIWRFGCNQDVMGHSGKGLIGLRIDGVENLVLDNIRIENLASESKLGSMACGDYDGMSFQGEGGHFKQAPPMQMGFSGNNIQGISLISSTNIEIGDISVKNMQSHYGEGYGVSFWTSNEITIQKDALIVVSNVQTGQKLAKGLVEYDSYPNRSPEACGVRMETDDTSELYDTSITFESENPLLNMIACNIKGHESCLGGDTTNPNTMYGNYLGDDSAVCEGIESFDDLASYYQVNEMKNSRNFNHQSGNGKNKNKNNNLDSNVAINNDKNNNNDDNDENNEKTENDKLSKKEKQNSIDFSDLTNIYSLMSLITIMVISAIVTFLFFLVCQNFCCNDKRKNNNPNNDPNYRHNNILKSHKIKFDYTYETLPTWNRSDDMQSYGTI